MVFTLSLVPDLFQIFCNINIFVGKLKLCGYKKSFSDIILLCRGDSTVDFDSLRFVAQSVCTDEIGQLSDLSYRADYRCKDENWRGGFSSGKIVGVERCFGRGLQTRYVVVLQ